MKVVAKHGNQFITVDLTVLPEVGEEVQFIVPGAST